MIPPRLLLRFDVKRLLLAGNPCYHCRHDPLTTALPSMFLFFILMDGCVTGYDP
jgi:hypothetical protein